MFSTKQFATQPYASAADFCRIFEREMNGLYLLSYLLTADGALAEGDIWRQESIVGSVFEGTVRVNRGPGERGQVVPRIEGTAHVTGQATLILDPCDPFQMGIREL